MIAKGVDVKTVKEICGHADISTTTNYVYLIQGSVNKVAKTFSIEPELTATATPPTLKVVQSN